jgi:Avidin family
MLFETYHLGDVMKLIALGTVAAVAITCFQQAYAKNQTITYQNTRGSTLILKFSDNDSLTGTFITAVASKKCQQAIGMKRPITGYVVNDAIAVSVSYPMCGSVVTFIGHIDPSKTHIDTTALLARQSKYFYPKGPAAEFITHDVFTKVKS